MSELKDYSEEIYELAFQLSKEIVEDFEIPDYGVYPEDFLHKLIFNDGNERNVYLFPKINVGFCFIEFKILLSSFAYQVVWLIESMLTDEGLWKQVKPSVIYELNKRNINALTLFNLEASEIPEIVNGVTKGLLKLFISNLPNFTNSAIIDAFGNSKVGYYQHRIKPALKEHWKTLGLPDDFELITRDQLDEVSKDYSDIKRWNLGDKKQLLNIETLIDEAEYLKKRYQEAKKREKSCYKSNKVLYPNCSPEDWKKKWSEIQKDEFPDLKFIVSSENGALRANELALEQLHILYGYSTEYIRKELIPKSQKLRGKK